VASVDVIVLGAPDVVRGAVSRMVGDGMLMQPPGGTTHPLVSHMSHRS
jgi:hypothetical protein